MASQPPAAPQDEPAPGSLDDVLAAYLVDAERGQADLADYLARFPDLADQLREFVQQLEAVDQLASPLRRITPPPPPMGRVRYFGDYELIDELGRGGMGVVYKARQVPLNRPVAVKMLLAGQLATPESVQRFEAEAEAAAKLDHPGIVTIFEVGCHEGQHYYSMVWVDGPNLNSVIQHGPSPPREAANLVRQIAAAAAYAHERGVIHRDLKPANVLLDEHGEPRIADFGLARIVERDSQLTGSEQILGTPSYMAPEQCRPAGQRDESIGAAADVYALGALLYALLVGRPPFQSSSPVDTMRQVVDDDPIPPRSLVAAVPADLQTVCLRCLEKNPSERFGSAEHLMQELDRYLQGRPILSRPAGWSRRVWKWCQRRPAVASLLGVLVTTIVTVLGVGLWFHFQLQEAVEVAQASDREAQRESARADEHYQQARTALRKIVRRFAEPQFQGVPRLRQLQQKTLEDALVFYEAALAQWESPEAAVRFDAAIALRQTGNLQLQLGQPQKARVNYRRTRELLEELHREDPQNEAYAAELAGHYHNLGILEGKKKEALDWFQKSLQLRRQWASPERPRWVSSVAFCHHLLGTYYQQNGNPDDAAREYGRSLDIWQQLVESEPDPEFQSGLADTLVNLALVLHGQAKLTKAEQTFQRAETILSQLVKTKPHTYKYATSRASNLLNWGNLAAQHKDHDVALSRYTTAVTQLDDVLTREPTHATARATITRALGARAMLRQAINGDGDSIEDWRRGAKLAPASIQPTMQIFLALALAGDKQFAPAASAADAVALESLAGVSLYNLALAYATCARNEADDARREQLRERAIQCLQRAHRLKFFNSPVMWFKLWFSGDFQGLYDHPGFPRLGPSP